MKRAAVIRLLREGLVTHEEAADLALDVEANGA
jgi:hypothetical protein